MAGNEDAVASFTAITGTDDATARFFLESAGGNQEAAVRAFFESADQGDPMQAEGEAAQPAAAAAAPAQPQGPQQAWGQGAYPGAGGSSSAQAAKGKKKKKASGSKVATFADLGGEEEDSEEDEQNEYYAGGQKSGQVVKAPPTGDQGAAVDEFFGRAREAGARLAGEAEDAPGGSRGGAFKGTGRTLTGGETPAAPPPQQPITHTIAFYADGTFTVNDGPPRRADDPANRPFLEAVGRGVCPPELEGNAAGVNVNLVRHNTPYQPPRGPQGSAAAAAFQGTGQTLGGSGGGAGAGSSSSAPAEGPSSSSAGPSGASGAASSATEPGVEWNGPNPELPTTSVQLRLADGSRMVARLNLRQTVGDLRRFIAAARRDLTRPYTLHLTHPPRALTDDAATIEAAGLANAVVMQKYV